MGSGLWFKVQGLLLQDMASWSRDGIAGLQSVVLYSLPAGRRYRHGPPGGFGG